MRHMNRIIVFTSNPVILQFSWWNLLLILFSWINWSHPVHIYTCNVIKQTSPSALFLNGVVTLVTWHGNNRECGCQSRVAWFYNPQLGGTCVYVNRLCLNYRSLIWDNKIFLLLLQWRDILFDLICIISYIKPCRKF